MKKKDSNIDPRKQKAEELNEKFAFASQTRKAGSDYIGMYLLPMLGKLLDKDLNKVEAGDKNEYVSVDNRWDGDPNTLFQHVTFKDLPDDSRVDVYIENIEKDPHMTPQQYEQFEQDWHKKSYKTLTKKLKLKNAEILEQIMNSSAMWRMATVSLYDSDQNKQEWVKMYNVMEDVLEKDQSLFDWIVQQVENEKYSINRLIQIIDHEIELMLSGKYSRRRKLHY